MEVMTARAVCGVRPDSFSTDSLICSMVSGASARKLPAGVCLIDWRTVCSTPWSSITTSSRPLPPVERCPRKRPSSMRAYSVSIRGSFSFVPQATRLSRIERMLRTGTCSSSRRRSTSAIFSGGSAFTVSATRFG